MFQLNSPTVHGFVEKCRTVRGDVSDDPVIFKEAMKMLIETRTAESLKGGDSIDPT